MILRTLLLLFLMSGIAFAGNAQRTYTLVSYNCENLFDIRHDSLKNDHEFLPDGERRWSFSRYWRKVNDIGRVILQTGGQGNEWTLPDIVGLVEVENDSVMHTLTRRSLLRNACYNYVITNSEDDRGVDVAMMYNSNRMRLLTHENMKSPVVEGIRRTRDILYASLATAYHDTLHVFIVHLPSRASGQYHTEGYRIRLVNQILAKVDTLQAAGARNILVLGDFNDYSYNRSIKRITESGFHEVTTGVRGLFHPDMVCGTYYFRQEWGSLDHIFVTSTITPKKCFIFDADWILEEGSGGVLKPRRTFLGNYYHGGVSDHLPLVLRFAIQK